MSINKNKKKSQAVALAVCLLSVNFPGAAAAAPNPNFIATPADLKARIPAQLKITKPDFVVFVPEVTDTGVNDTGNEHFLVFDGPDGSLMAVWTQSSAESQPDQHIAFARSDDEGKTWTKPRIVAGPKKPGDGYMASWGYPLVSKSGRIYILYSQNIGRVDGFPHHTGWLHGIFSDDNGATWSKPQNVPLRRSIYDNPDTTMPPNILCWQKPNRLGKEGKYFAGVTRWTSFAVTKQPAKSWMSADARVEFMRFENIDANPEPKDIKISWFAFNEKALSVPYPEVPQVSACQEPSVVKLPDGRLFCVMRTASGSPYWSVSADIGETWTKARPLLRKDGGAPLLHPLSPCPMYDMGGNTAGSGSYVLFIHNHDGHYKNFGPRDSSNHRRPINIVRGHFKAGADQPVWFDEPEFFFDHNGVSLGKPGTKGRTDLALYASFTVRNGVPVLWYPDRKFFLLGKKISVPLLASADPAPATDWRRSKPDVTVYLPKGVEHHDTDNEHFLVFPSPSGKELLALWTQSSVEGRGDNRAMLARSTDGVKWSEPQKIAGTTPGTKEPQAGWAFPVVAKTGRLYIFFTKQAELNDGNPQGCGTMGCRYSDDEGRTWTDGTDIPMPRNRFDNPDPRVPKNWIVWQKPIRDSKGRWLAGYTQVTSSTLQKTEVAKRWWQWESRCQFMRFDNLDEGPLPENLKITWLPDDEKGLAEPHPSTGGDAASEPSVVLLPDGHLFTTMRTWTGEIWYSVSDDDGRTWRTPEVMRYRDGGDPVLHPFAPCPIYALNDGRYILLFHNNNGQVGTHNEREVKWKVNHLNYIRNPAFIAMGEFRPKAKQPIWFSAPKQILDTQGVIVGPKKTAEIATYTSITEWKDQRMLWYPDRKYYLLGKRLPDSLLADMTVPAK